MGDDDKNEEADRWKKEELEKEYKKLKKDYEELKELAIWMTGCGYDFTQHGYFIEKRDKLLKKAASGMTSTSFSGTECKDMLEANLEVR